jgi:hypothetical protein
MIVDLEPWEYEHAYQVGVRRYTENWNKQDASYYNKSSMEEDRNAQVAAAICELAVAKHTNQYWHGSVWDGRKHKKYKGMPDVGKNIEVRRVRTQSGPAVREKDLDRNLVIWGAELVDPEYRKVRLLGWIDAQNGYDIGIQKTGYKVVPKELLNKDWIEEEIDV